MGKEILVKDVEGGWVENWGFDIVEVRNLRRDRKRAKFVEFHAQQMEGIIKMVMGY